MTLASAAVLLFLVMDPLGNILLFVAALQGVAPERRVRVVVRELVIAYLILVAFLFVGQPLLGLLQITGPALTIAGALVLFLIALRMVFPTAERNLSENVGGEPFIVPLAIPYVAGPSAMATVLLLVSREPSRWPAWLGALTAAWIVSAVILMLGGRLSRLLGQKGLVALERLMGLVLVAVAVQMFLEGLRVALLFQYQRDKQGLTARLCFIYDTVMWLSAELAAFARVVELGSFTAAARALGVPKVALSRALKALEARTGTRLLERTTRRVTLTDAGRALLPWSQRIAAETDAVRRAISLQSGTRPGVRVLADSAWGRLLLTPLVPRFLERHASIPLEVELLAQLPVTAAPDWDVLIQNGQPGAGLVATALGAPPVILCATPAWLQAHGTPLRPADLPRDALLIAGTAVDSLRLKRGHETALLPISPRLAINDPAVVHAATAAGAGIGALPEFLCRQGLAMGRLVRVLPDWFAADVVELYAVCDLARAARPEVRALIDFLVANMVPVLGPADPGR